MSIIELSAATVGLITNFLKDGGKTTQEILKHLSDKLELENEGFLKESMLASETYFPTMAHISFPIIGLTTKFKMF